MQVKLNFPATKYAELSTFMDSVSLEELVMAIRRQSQGFARGSSGYVVPFILHFASHLL